MIVERLAPMPAKPQNITVERWLPYGPTERRVIYKSAPPARQAARPRNLVIQWQAPEVLVQSQTQHLGVSKMRPEAYRQKYGAQLLKVMFWQRKKGVSTLLSTS